MSYRRLSAVLILSLIAVVTFVWLSRTARALGMPSEPVVDGSLLDTGELSSNIYLPVIFNDYGPRSSRLGYCSVSGPVTRYPEIRRLAAGWYVNFSVANDPPLPLGMEYVRTVRLHQLTECWPDRLEDRDSCPYVTPYTYTLVSPTSTDAIVSIAQANPGALWLIGNEMDRRDWEGGGQDEMLPKVYAMAYHDLYHLIKSADPTALVAIGGIIQATPARLDYLTAIWDRYHEVYGRDMPVDVWNVHNFIFQEHCERHGASVPPGYSGCEGTMYADEDHDNMEIFDRQIRAFRKWMKDHGQQNKPLIVSEYGIVYWHVERLNNWEAVQSFMLKTFDYFMNTKDCSLGYPADECRLVQRWAWYSLDGSMGVYNSHSDLFDASTRQITPLGETFADYAHAHLDTW